MQNVSDSPPRAPPIKYTAPLGTRWAKEKAAAGGAAAFDLPTDPKSIGPWILGECVGKGASGRVKIAKHRRTGQLAAVKILPIAPLVNSRASLATQQAKTDKQRLGIDREITMMKLMNHPNIMRIYDVYEGDQELFLVLEYVEGGELFDFLVNRGRLPPNEALIYFRQIVYGLNYAHTFSIIHRDLKPENILIASLSPPQIKIADWGMAAFAPPTLQLETSCGSPHYASPEIVNGEKYQGNATDIWSCGVILYALLTGRLPFDDKNVRTLLSKVKSGKYEMPSWIDPLARDLLSKMLIVDVNQRISIPAILSHPWLLSQPAIPFSSSEGASYTLLAPPLPPSPSILARPIVSPDLIDSELLSSLRIIWGRHTDAQGDSIRRDLCAPAGQGVHAKAFYFLLGKYREESYKNRTHDAEHELRRGSAPSSVGFETLKFDLGWELERSSGLRKYEAPKPHHIFANPPKSSMTTAAKTAPSYPSHISMGPLPVIAPRKRTFTDGSLPSKDRTETPAGPRPHLKNEKAPIEGRKPQLLPTQQGVLPALSVTHAPPKSSLGAGRGGPRTSPTHRAYTSSSVVSGARENDQVGPTSIGFSRNLQQIQARAAYASHRPKSSVGPITPFVDAEKKAMFSPSLLPTSPLLNAREPHRARQPLSPKILAGSGVSSLGDMSLPLLTAPKTENPQLQRTMDEITQKVNDLVQAVTQAPATIGDGKEMGKATTHTKTSEDKENKSVEESWSHVSAEGDHSGGVGLGVGVVVNRDVGKDMANIGPPAISPTKARKEKEKKARPPPLELPSQNPGKRSTFVMLGSPIALSSPIHPPPSSRLLTSPVVGEFKGWFSNLFSWKHSNGQNGILYSADDIHLTRSNVAGLLEHLGITTSNNTPGGSSPAEQTEILVCRLDQPCVDPATGISLKNVRFRVEFRAGPGPSDPQSLMSPDAEESPYSLATTVAPNSSYLVTPNLGSSSRPRTSILLGRTSSNISSLPSSAGLAKWDFPPGCLCAIALVHEKGSMSTFRAVWRKLKEEYGDASTAYPCFSPAIPNTPFVETQRMAL